MGLKVLIDFSNNVEYRTNTCTDSNQDVFKVERL